MFFFSSSLTNFEENLWLLNLYELQFSSSEQKSSRCETKSAIALSESEAVVDFRKPQEIELKSLPFTITFYYYEVSFYSKRFI
jgi:hypothetical protein